MRTVKEVAGLTGISVRTLQYYDEIGVFKPTCVSDAGYRMYDDEALNTLQQILFFKELDFSLKEIKSIMDNPDFDRTEIFRRQKDLLKEKRDRLNRLLELLEKLERGEACMSFREFDLSEYLEALERFRRENAEKIIQHWGSMDKFEEFLEKARENHDEIARNAVKFYGSVEKYTAAMKESLGHFSENMEKMERIKESGYVEENQRLTSLLLSDLTKDVASDEVQDLVGQLINLLKPEDRPVMDLGDNYWEIVTDGYLNNENMIKVMDMKYGAGASAFMGKALQYYFKGSI